VVVVVRCAKKAEEIFKKDDPTTWKPATEALVDCIVKHWDSCEGL
jgi:hypothetical protein